jgi:hypothetical protein
MPCATKCPACRLQQGLNHCRHNHHSTAYVKGESACAKRLARNGLLVAYPCFCGPWYEMFCCPRQGFIFVHQPRMQCRLALCRKLKMIFMSSRSQIIYHGLPTTPTQQSPLLNPLIAARKLSPLHSDPSLRATHKTLTCRPGVQERSVFPPSCFFSKQSSHKIPV